MVIQGIRNKVSSLFGQKKKTIDILMVDKTKSIEMKKVTPTNAKFTLGDNKDKTTYIVDEKAIYFFKEKPLLFYYEGNVSPLLFTTQGLSNSVSGDEFTKIIETKAVTDLLTASSDDYDINFVLLIATAGMSLVILLNQLGVLNLGK